ncbi:MAG TPA: hypothetical protein VK699_13385 [Terriglobales bacterium]|jgi:uncharacterized repeat protein (TIGR01451 family)|nr:hypothetical protein [Terriglobales bacterium]
MKTNRFGISRIHGLSWLRTRSTCAVIGILLGTAGSSYGLPPLAVNKLHGSEVQATYTGKSSAVGALHSSSAQPLSLATDDLNNDGAPDLLVGYSANGHGFIAVYLGNIDAFAPSSPEIYQAIQAGRMPASFNPAVQLIDLPEAVDFMVIGDFNRDGKKDILAAAHGGGLYLLPGNGRGGFGPAQAVSLPGEVTALATGEFNKADGAADVAVGITGQDGPAVLIFEGASGGLSGQPMKYSLTAEATSLAFDSLDNDAFLDLAIAAGDEVIILHGENQAAGKNLASRVEHIKVGFNIRSLTLGTFTWNRDNKRSMALLSEDGTIHLLQRSDLDTRPLTAREAAALKRNAGHLWQSGTKRVQWSLAKQLYTGLTTVAGNFAGQLLVASQISPREVNDLLAVDQAGRKINIVRPGDERLQLQNKAFAGGDTQSEVNLAPIAMDMEGEPTAVLAMPKKVNGERDLIVLQSGQAAPISLVNASPATITVNRTDDVHVSTCAPGGVNDCSLRGAIDFANANPGTTINVPAGTYQLTIPTTLEQGNANGDLDVNAPGTTIVGAGAATTIIQQTVADRVMDINFASNANFTFGISGVTITGGHDVSGLGGGGLLAGGSANSYTVTNCIFDSNAVNGTATNTPGGAISLRVGGNLSVTASTFTNNDAGASSGGAISMSPTADTNTTFQITNSTFSNNQASGEGGAVADQLNGGASSYMTTISNSTFTGNTVISGATTTGGGALDIDIGSGAATVTQSTFDSNQDADASGHGGAIAVTSGIVTAHFNRFVNNTAANAFNGNAVFSSGGTGDFTDNWWANIGGPNPDDVVIGGGLLLTVPSLTLTLIPDSVSIPASSSTGLTAGFLTDTLGGPIAASDLTAVTGLPVTFGATGGNITGADANIQASGTASATFTSTVTGTDSATATVDGATATTTIQAGVTGQPPSLSKLFLPDTIQVNGTSLLNFTIINPNSDVTLTGIQFTDALPAGLVVSSSTQFNSNDCGGTITAVPGSSSISLSGGIVAPSVGLLPPPPPILSIASRHQVSASRSVLSQASSAATGACFISVEVQATTTGVMNNTTGPISAFESGPGAPSNTASLTVNAAPVVVPPTLAKAFGAPSVPLNGTTSLSFTVANPNSTRELVNIAFNDMLPSGLLVASPNNMMGSCLANAAVIADPGSNNVSLTALALPGSSSCMLSVDVVGITSGVKNNTTSNITATFDDGSGTFIGITGAPASASMVVVVPPSISKSFNPNVIAPNVPSTLTFTITNPAINPVAESGVAFSDTLPAGLMVANSSTTVCGGTLTTTAPTGIALSGASIGVNSQCVFNVMFIAAAPGNYTNITGAVSSTNGGTGNTATAILSVKNADLTITKTHNGDFSRRSTGTYTITVSNSASAGPTNGTVTVVDTLPDVEHTLGPVTLTGTGWTCNLGTLTCTRSDSLPPGDVWPAITLVVDVPQNIRANVINSATVSGGGDPNSHTANDPTHIGPPDNDKGKDKDKNRDGWRNDWKKK